MQCARRKTSRPPLRGVNSALQIICRKIAYQLSLFLFNTLPYYTVITHKRVKMLEIGRVLKIIFAFGVIVGELGCGEIC